MYGLELARTFFYKRKPRQIKWLLYISLFLSLSNVQYAQGNYSCESIFIPTLQDVPYEQFKENILKVLTGESIEQDLFLRWNIPFPTQKEQGKYVWSRKRMRTYRGMPREDQPFVAVAKMFGDPGIEKDFFYEKVYSKYEDRFRDELIQNLHKIDAELEGERTSMGTIMTRQQFIDGEFKSYVGSLRIYDGSLRPWGIQFLSIDLSMQNTPAPQLPFQRINHYRKIRLNVDNQVRDWIRSGNKVFEIGKFALEGSPEMVRRAKKAMELYLSQYILQPFSDAIILVHVASKAHARLYDREYGFQVLEEFQVPGSQEKEKIMMTTASELRRRLLN